MVHSVLEKMEPYCNWHSRSLRKYVMRWTLVIIPENRPQGEEEAAEIEKQREQGLTSGSLLIESGLKSLTTNSRRSQRSTKNLLHSETIIESDENELKKSMQRTRRRRKSQDVIIQKVREIDRSWAELEGELTVFDFRKPIVVLQGKARVDYGLEDIAESETGYVAAASPTPSTSRARIEEFLESQEPPCLLSTPVTMESGDAFSVCFAPGCIFMAPPGSMMNSKELSAISGGSGKHRKSMIDKSKVKVRHKKTFLQRDENTHDAALVLATPANMDGALRMDSDTPKKSNSTAIDLDQGRSKMSTERPKHANTLVGMKHAGQEITRFHDYQKLHADDHIKFAGTGQSRLVSVKVDADLADKAPNIRKVESDVVNITDSNLDDVLGDLEDLGGDTGRPSSDGRKVSTIAPLQAFATKQKGGGAAGGTHTHGALVDSTPPPSSSSRRPRTLK